MNSYGTLIIGAGITGLATAAELSNRGDDDYLVLEASSEVGGYCKTVKTDGFVWDYSGHFFHFKHAEIEAWLRERMVGQRIVSVVKKSFIAYGGERIDFPFQKNIHQLPKDEFIDCLVDLYFAQSSDVSRTAPNLDEGGASRPASSSSEESFLDMLHARFGRSICEKFLVPYNEKLYACHLGTLDKDAMGRFFPHANLTDVIRNMRYADNASYNATFTYPEGGAIEYVNAFLQSVEAPRIALSEALLAVDVDRKIARTSRREIRFERLVSSAPFDAFARICALAHDGTAWASNKVLVFNLGFDAKGPSDVHWMYYPSRDTVFYRVGWYDNILGSDRMSLYVEVGFPKDAPIDLPAVRARVLDGLRKEGVITTQRLIAEHSVVLDPGYVHVTRRSLAEHSRLTAWLRQRGIWSIGRYGGWTYCSIEDNIVEARAVVASFSSGK